MMNVAVPRPPRALTAIAAVLALSAIPAAAPAVAQEVQPATTPSLSLPQDVNTGSPATARSTTPATPTVTLPPESTAPVNTPTDTATTAGTSPQSSPAASAIPVAPPTAPTAQQAPTTQQTVVRPDAAPPATPDEAASEPAPARTATRSQAAPRAERATAQPSPAQTSAARPSVPTAQDAGTAADGALARGAVPPASPAPARAEAPPANPAAPPPARAATDDGNLPVVEIAGILAALGIAGVGVVAMTRRRRNDPVYEEAAYEPTPIEPVGAMDPVPAPAPVVEAIEPDVPEPGIVERAPSLRPAAATTVAGTGMGATAILAAAPLPETPEERYELLDRMAAAEPDEGNPFTSRKGRLRRARLQLQHREHVEAERPQAPADRSFDFRTYKSTTGPATRQAPGSSTPATDRELTKA